MKPVYAPWTPEQVEAIRKWQDYPNNPAYTCDGDRYDAAHAAYRARRGGEFGKLEATERGLRCPVCGYTQQWVADFIVSEEPPDPQPGDHWEVRVPGKRMIRKFVAQVYLKSVGPYPQVRKLYVDWARSPKGRYSGMRVEDLKKYGMLLSTKAQRDAAWDKKLKSPKMRRLAQAIAKAIKQRRKGSV